MLASLPSPGSEAHAQAAPVAPPGPPERAGTPVEPRRVLAALKRAKRRLVIATVIAAVAGAVVGKLTPKSYAASATVLWQPPAVAHIEPARELATLAQSVKLPANILAVRAKVSSTNTVEQMAKALDVTLGDNSMLLTITARERSPERSAELAQAAVDVFIEAQREGAAEKLREVVKALRASLAQAEAEHDQSRGRYDDFRIQNSVDDFPTEVQAAIQDVARLRVAVNDARVELGSLAARQDALQRAQARSPESVVLSRSEQNFDETRAGQLATELAELKGRYSSDHPRVQAIEAELTALRAQARATQPTVSGQTVGRSSLRDTLSAQIEESQAARSAVTERAKSLETLQREAGSRASALTAVQGEAARLLADVKVNEEHVALLLKQLAMGEDDVRGATSAFRLVSNATPPEHSEKAIGRIIAASTPLLVLIVGLLVIAGREIARARIVAGTEAAFFAKAPVLWSTSWPLAVSAPNDATRADAAQEASALARELADVCEQRTGVLGVAPLGDATPAHDAARMLVDRLERRGRKVCLVDAAAPPAHEGTSAADLFESGAFGTRIAAHLARHDFVIVVLPSATDVGAMRAVVRWLDGLLVVVESGTQPLDVLGGLTDATADRGRGVGVVVVRVPHDLLPAGHREVGDRSLTFREPSAQRRAIVTAGSIPRAGDGDAPDKAPRRRASRKKRIVIEEQPTLEVEEDHSPVPALIAPRRRRRS
jgi:uncharacterized protein involved in exopolysaccharide biosynthesis